MEGIPFIPNFTIPKREYTISMNNEVTSYSLGTDTHSGLEFRLQFMPQFFKEHGTGPMTCHTHNYYQIIWFRRGHGYHRVDYEDYPVSDNTLFFLAPGQLHNFDGANDYKGIIIQFNASFMADEETKESIFLKYNVFNAFGSAPYYKVTEEEAERLLNLVNEMNREYSLTAAFAHKDYMQYLIRIFLIRVMRTGERAEPEKLYVTSTANLMFVRFRQLLEQNFRRVHTVKEYAQMLNVSTRSLTEYVKKSVHRTPLELINERICLEAKRQIQHSTLRINQIGYDLGFDDPSYFVKFFKRQTKHKPTDFRERKMKKIAIPTAEGKLWPHFGKAPEVTFFTIEDNNIVKTETLQAPEHAHGAMPRFIKEHGATDVICGGLGAGAVQMLNALGIALHGGAPVMPVEDVVKQFLDGTLEFGDSTCHHDGCGQ